MSTRHHLAAIAIAAATAAVLFLLLLLVFLYLKFRRRLTPEHDPPPPLGLDPAVLRSLPVSVHTSKEPMECAVCITEIADGEEVRVLPACGHCFHLDCVDMWFHSHPTCPLCRRPVGPSREGPHVLSGDRYSTELPNLPTNVLFWGNLDRVSAGCGSPSVTPQGSSLGSCGGEGVVRIDVHSSKMPGSRRWRRG